MISLDDVTSNIGYLSTPRRGESAEDFAKRAGIKAAQKYFKDPAKAFGEFYGGDIGGAAAGGILSGAGALLSTGDPMRALEVGGKSALTKYATSKVPIAGAGLSMLQGIQSGESAEKSIMDTAASGILGLAGPWGVAAAGVPMALEALASNVERNRAARNKAHIGFDTDTGKMSVQFGGKGETKGTWGELSDAGRRKLASVVKDEALQRQSEYSQYITPLLGEDVDIRDAYASRGIQESRLDPSKHFRSFTQEELMRFNDPEFQSMSYDFLYRLQGYRREAERHLSRGSWD